MELEFSDWFIPALSALTAIVALIFKSADNKKAKRNLKILRWIIIPAAIILFFVQVKSTQSDNIEKNKRKIEHEKEQKELKIYYENQIELLTKTHHVSNQTMKKSDSIISSAQKLNKQLTENYLKLSGQYNSLLKTTENQVYDLVNKPIYLDVLYRIKKGKDFNFLNKKSEVIFFLNKYHYRMGICDENDILQERNCASYNSDASEFTKARSLFMDNNSFHFLPHFQFDKEIFIKVMVTKKFNVSQINGLINFKSANQISISKTIDLKGAEQIQTKDENIEYSIDGGAIRIGGINHQLEPLDKSYRKSTGYEYLNFKIKK